MSRQKVDLWQLLCIYKLPYLCISVELWQLIVLNNNCNLLIVRFVLCYECKYSCALDLQYNAKTIYANHKV